MSDSLPAPPDLSTLLEEGPIALFLDFDGTLVELAPTPDAIVVPPDLVEQLDGLGARLDGRLALVSGRALSDLEKHLGTIRCAAAGSHGVERRQADGAALGGPPEALPAQARRELEDFADREGALLERKTFGAALHYRAQPELEHNCLDVANDLVGRHDLEIKRGKSVIELMRPGADKGGAVRAFMEVAPFVGARPVFLGDDTTDEDGFRAACELGGIAIIVGDRRPTDAAFALADPAAVHAWLGL